MVRPHIRNCSNLIFKMVKAIFDSLSSLDQTKMYQEFNPKFREIKLGSYKEKHWEHSISYQKKVLEIINIK